MWEFAFGYNTIDESNIFIYLYIIKPSSLFIMLLNRIIIIVAILLVSVNVWAQQGTKAKGKGAKEQVVIQSSVQCGMCVETIEGALNKVSGVKKVNVNLPKQRIRVRFDPTQTNPDAIRTAISQAGYDADALKADPNAYSKLPACCQKDGHQKAKGKS
jgi:periplasmic mercuric ion binding protein